MNRITLGVKKTYSSIVVFSNVLFELGKNELNMVITFNNDIKGFNCKIKVLKIQ